jgi:hypothetical protein
MDTWVIVAIVVALAVVLVGGIALWMASEKRRSEELRGGFGPEYERTLAETGNRRRAESELRDRERRVQEMELRPLSAEERDRFQTEWTSSQARFVDDPAGAVADADRLITDVMETRGYPTGDFDQQVSDVSVGHAHVVENYRRAHGIALANEQGQATTEDLRQAMVYYRSLFSDLLETAEPEVAATRS